MDGLRERQEVSGAQTQVSGCRWEGAGSPGGGGRAHGDRCRRMPEWRGRAASVLRGWWSGGWGAGKGSRVRTALCGHCYHLVYNYKKLMILKTGAHSVLELYCSVTRNRVGLICVGAFGIWATQRKRMIFNTGAYPALELYCSDTRGASGGWGEWG